MNRRELILASTVLLFSGQALASAAAPSTLLQRKRLHPDADSVTFSGATLGAARKPLELRTRNNALWIKSISWIDDSGASFSVALNRNVPKDTAVKLPLMEAPRRITIDVTCLPLATRETPVELRAR